MTYPSESGKVLGSILRQKMDEFVNDDFTINVPPYSCINLVTSSSHDLNMKAWLATADGISEYIEGYMTTNMTTKGAYVYTETATVPPPPPIVPAMDTISDLPTFGTAEKKDSYDILNLALPMMIFAGDDSIDIKKLENDPTLAIKENLKIIAMWLNIPPIPFTQSTLQKDKEPLYSLNGTGQIIFPNAIGLVDEIAQDILNAMKDLGDEITFIDANNIFATGVVNMLNGVTDDTQDPTNLVYSFDLGSVVPVATNKTPLPGIYFGLSKGTVKFVSDYQAKVQAPVIAPPLGLVTLTIEIPLLEVDLSDIVVAFIDKFFGDMDMTDEDMSEMKKNFGDVLRITFNGLFDGGKVVLSDLDNAITSFISKIEERLSIDNLTKKLTKRMYNFSAKLRAKVYAYFEKIGLVFEKIEEKIREIIEAIFNLPSVIQLIIETIVDAIKEKVETFIKEFIASVIEKMIPGPPLPAPTVLVLVAEKIKKAVEVILSIVETIKTIIENVINFIVGIIETVVSFVERIAKFLIDKVNVWIQKIEELLAMINPPEGAAECLVALGGLISALGVFTSFVDSGLDSVPEQPELPSEFAKAMETYYVTNANVLDTSASMLPQGKSNFKWQFVTNSATSGFSHINNGALSGTSFEDNAISVFSADLNQSYTSNFERVFGGFTVSSVPYRGVIGERITHSEYIKDIFAGLGLSIITYSQSLDYNVYSMTMDKYNYDTSAMEADTDKKMFYGYFVKLLMSTNNPPIVEGYYRGWVLESLLNTEFRSSVRYGTHYYVNKITGAKLSVELGDYYIEVVRMIPYSQVPRIPASSISSQESLAIITQ